ncbi:LON peptidase substrate-binding domain-containing protein [Pseudonocardia sp. MH-G8]|uniref:LON peptidase substrate-binding domain-containing protein n=1 Tax=Pseudonocardia sp. MH-G8 TaxID=1854588 RepID=UPI000BA15617|nr:LON peptidase substrate-binding domain-containing protein [Pseudonocardia sp. MH-G8]OZM76301.1 peptidase [Pseudonocardia sp. MH-G8]
MNTTETLPLFPLGTVLLPGATMPLHIFEPRYRQLTLDLVNGIVPDREFGVVAVREGFGPDDDGIAGLHAIGCTAHLRDVHQLPDGRFDIITRGARRFRLLDLDEDSKPYLVGAVEFLPDDEPAGATPSELTDVLAAAARAAHRRYCRTAWKNGDWTEPEPDVEPGNLPHVLAADCLLPVGDRQRLLEQTSPVERLRLVRMLLARETGLLAQLRAVPTPITTYAVDHSLN